VDNLTGGMNQYVFGETHYIVILFFILLQIKSSKNDTVFCVTTPFNSEKTRRFGRISSIMMEEYAKQKKTAELLTL
jgi:hypothetical protein